jgi:methionine biosynthesis protein MetW
LNPQKNEKEIWTKMSGKAIPKFYETHYGHRQLNERSKKVLNHVSLLRPRRLLDIGCGTGNLLSMLQVNVDEVYGVEVSKTAVQACKDKGLAVFYVDVNNEKLPFGSSFFDVVICSEVLEHLFDPDFLMEEIYRVLSAKGYLVLTTPNLAWWLNRILLLFGFQPYNTEVSSRLNLGKPRNVYEGVAGHIRPFTWRSLKELLSIYGFEVVKYFGTHDWNISLKILGLIDKLLSKKISLASNLGVVCQKTVHCRNAHGRLLNELM